MIYNHIVITYIYTYTYIYICIYIISYYILFIAIIIIMKFGLIISTMTPVIILTINITSIKHI